MVELMKETAQSFNGERITDDLYDRLFDKVLEAQEEVGMLPPLKDLGFHNGERLEYSRGARSIIDLTPCYFCWEDE